MYIDQEILNWALNSLGEYMVIVDTKGIIIMMTDGYKEFLGCENPEGKHVTEVIENTRLHLIAQEGSNEIGTIQEVSGHKMISMRVPMIINGELKGAIGRVMFKDIDNLKILNNKIMNLEQELEFYKNGIKAENTAQHTFDRLIGVDSGFREIVKFAEKVAKGDSSVLITGKSGTGKELLAEAIHNSSKRARMPFVKINCGAIPPELFESEMFGYEEGAFTGAKRTGKKGKFELADGGTVLLDEIGDMPLFMQVKLLRVLQEREIVRVGSNDVRKIDVRIIAATNKDLQSLTKEGKFREDLYYRLNVMHINIPSLKERIDDVEELAEHLRVKLCNKFGVYSEGISKEAIDYLKSYDWPGNVRELENVIERAINLLNAELIIMPEHLPKKILQANKEIIINQGKQLKHVTDELEKEMILQVLNESKGNKNEAAKKLGISRQGLYKKIKRLNLEI
ncbi:sigma-54 interaction domain-containing protein [Clostridium culturomicium]|uniref:sigma-54 interaction domain-containing protein n=1 Tax=Clostridium culturomicium TaxID=1499683 RepID=UPI00058C4028|nr:sigma 54-interacting transcriptional regulator [Clostridium culturomicium]